MVWAQALQLVLAILIHIAHHLFLVILADSFVLSKSTRAVLDWRLHDVFAEADDLRQVLVLLDAHGVAS